MTRPTSAAQSSASARKILKRLCSVPTAPFVEGKVVEFVEEFVRQRRRLNLKRDEFGNLLIELTAVGAGPKSGNKSARWVFTAHMDHPGFVADRMPDDHTLQAHFYGGVEPDYFLKSRVKFFAEGQEIGAVVTGYRNKTATRPARATLRIGQAVPPGTPGMWDVGEGRIQGKRFMSRVCDDLAGAAAALAMLDALAQRPPKTNIAVLLTRAEEEGFIGAIAASLHPTLLRKTDRLIAIECSAAQPYAPQGAGAIVRIGDRTSVFNSALSYFITQTAANLAKRDKRFKYQRALMPGGTCEATVYDIYGFAAGSICVPLGNYHNMDKKKKTIAPEYIDLGDWDSMVKLFLEIARHGHEYEPGHLELKRKIEKRFERFRSLL